MPHSPTLHLDYVNKTVISQLRPRAISLKMYILGAHDHYGSCPDRQHPASIARRQEYTNNSFSK
jgi:hypothetical protein